MRKQKNEPNASPYRPDVEPSHTTTVLHPPPLYPHLDASWPLDLCRWSTCSRIWRPWRLSNAVVARCMGRVRPPLLDPLLALDLLPSNPGPLPLGALPRHRWSREVRRKRERGSREREGGRHPPDMGGRERLPVPPPTGGGGWEMVLRHHLERGSHLR